MKRIRAGIKARFPKLAQVYRHAVNLLVYRLSPLLVGRSVFFVKRRKRPSVGKAVLKRPNLHIQMIRSPHDVESAVGTDAFWTDYFKDAGVRRRFEEDNLCFVALEGSALAGIRWCALSRNTTLVPPLPAGYDFASIPYFYGVLTHPRLRGQGVARALQQYANDHMFEREIAGISIMVWDKNQAALRLAEHHEFTPCGSVIHLRVLYRDFYFHRGSFFGVKK